MAYGDYHHNAYKAASWREENKTLQVVMLYEGAIRYVRQAKDAMEKGDIEGRYNGLTKACEIINGLQMSLDFEHGGEVAQLLYDYYAGLDMRLNHLHFHQDMAICDLCIRHLTMMRDAWHDVHQKTDGNTGGGGKDDERIMKQLKSLTDGTDVQASAFVALPAELASINVSA